MTSEDFKQLESLLGKLRGHLDARYCIIPGAVHDGPHLAVYDDEGRIAYQTTAMDLETAVKNIHKYKNNE